MIIVIVKIHVKIDFIDAFREATIINAMESSKEPGIVRFDLIQQQDDESRFILVEIYQNIEATRKHKDTNHYQRWRDNVAEMMEEPRQSIKFVNVFPDDSLWKYPK